VRRRGRWHAQHLRHQPLSRLLEQELADLHQKDAALLFPSGYTANEGAISTIARLLPGCIIFSDEMNHASMIEGIWRSGAEKQIFRHSDTADLDRLLRAVDPHRPKLVCFESVYSMDGDIAPIHALCDVAERHHALTYLDEVHAVGLYGPRGRGIAEHDGALHRITVIQGTLAKGFGVVGGYIAGPAPLVDCVGSFAPGFIFTTAMPPVIAAGALASVRYLKTSQVERTRHQERVARLKCLLTEAGLPPTRDAELHRTLHDRRCGPLQSRLGRAAATTPALSATDQLSDRAAEHRAAAHHTDAPARRRGDRPPCRGPVRRVGAAARIAGRGNPGRLTRPRRSRLDLRIIPQELWDRGTQQQRDVSARGRMQPYSGGRAPKYLFRGLSRGMPRRSASSLTSTTSGANRHVTRAARAFAAFTRSTRRYNSTRKALPGASIRHFIAVKNMLSVPVVEGIRDTQARLGAGKRSANLPPFVGRAFEYHPRRRLTRRVTRRRGSGD
jgi:7-keto-8-aminopelargonate synthetase-like enzyme